MINLIRTWRNRVKRAATPEEYYNTFRQTSSGRNVLTDMMKAHHVFSSTFEPDALATAFREGERNVVLRILTILDEHERKD